MNRKAGFYWVKVDGLNGETWEVAYWDPTGVASWFLCGNELDFFDRDFKEIREEMLQEPN